MSNKKKGCQAKEVRTLREAALLLGRAGKDSEVVEAQLDLHDAHVRAWEEQVLTLREAAWLLLGRRERFKSSPELKQIVEMIAYDLRVKLEPGPRRRIRRSVLVTWAGWKNRDWARRLGVAFKTEELVISALAASAGALETIHPADANLRAHFERCQAEKHALEAKAAELEAEVERLKALHRPGRPKKSLQK
ncbi:MAG TPA: hypothetical protein VLQ46_10480 [Casimicrobiaceae bacterium]|nr:hypothetical protein [Casimicrobiaceae bacterium]